LYHTHITFKDVTFSYEKAVSLFDTITLNFHSGWSGIVGVNGSGKTTLLKLATGLLEPQKGDIHLPEKLIFCPQRTDDPPQQFHDFFDSQDALACRLRGLLNMESRWRERWDTLSHGERKRVQIGTALWQGPRILAVDEPMNHLDIQARQMVSDSLVSFRGIGLVVSHDRDLLDRLCYQCIFLDPPRAVTRPGNFTEGSAQKGQEEEQARREFRLAREEVKRLRREATRRRHVADQQKKLRSKRGLAPRDHDARAKKDLARLTGKDGVAGRLLNQMQTRQRRAQEKLQKIRIRKTVQMGIWLEGSVSKRDALFLIKSEQIHFGNGASLLLPDLAMQPRDRIALTGPNGSGKSTLITKIIRMCPIPKEHLVYVPQEIPLEDSRNILDRVRSLSGNELGYIMTIISRLGSIPERLLESEIPSPGETRKLLLALGIVKVPHLIVLDEPTNHLDIDAVICLEQALRDCPCGLLLVSHDQRFLNALTNIRWNIYQDKRKDHLYNLQIH